MSKAITMLKEVQALLEEEQRQNRNRETALAITKIEEATMWLERRDKRVE